MEASAGISLELLGLRHCLKTQDSTLLYLSYSLFGQMEQITDLLKGFWCFATDSIALLENCCLFFRELVQKLGNFNLEGFADHSFFRLQNLLILDEIAQQRCIRDKQRIIQQRQTRHFA